MAQPRLNRILCLDDEPVIRQVLERALSSFYDVRLLPNSKNLTETLHTFEPELIILDVRMPGEDGWAVCARLRREKRFDSTPILFLSALLDETSMHTGYLSGGDYFLSKPFDIKELLVAVDALIGRKHRYPDEDSKETTGGIRPGVGGAGSVSPPPHREAAVHKMPEWAGRAGSDADSAFQ